MNASNKSPTGRVKRKCELFALGSCKRDRCPFQHIQPSLDAAEQKLKQEKEERQRLKMIKSMVVGGITNRGPNQAVMSGVLISSFTSGGSCICKACNIAFDVTQSEKKFYKSHNLSLPKRCKLCRDRARASR